MFRNYTGVTPTGADAHHDVPLSSMAVTAFANSDAQFVGDQLFPQVGTAKQSDKYYVIHKDAFLALPTQSALRAKKTAARKVEFTISSASYFCDNYALANENALEDLANADQAIMLRENSVNLVSMMLRRSQESRIAALVTTAANLGSGTTLTGGRKWNDFVNSDPLGDVTTAHAFIRQQTGLTANTGVIDWDTLQILKRHPGLLEMGYRYNQNGALTVDNIRELFQLQRLLVAGGVQNNANIGQTSSITNIWGNVFLLAHTQPAVGMQTMTLGLRFEWTPPEFGTSMQVKRAVESGAGKRNVEIVEVGHFQDARIVAPELGYLISSTL